MVMRVAARLRNYHRITKITWKHKQVFEQHTLRRVNTANASKTLITMLGFDFITGETWNYIKLESIFVIPSKTLVEPKF